MCLERWVWVGVVGLMSFPAAAVEPGKPSATALLAAANRAVGARNPDASMRNPDYLAEKFFGPEERAILGKFFPPALQALDMDFERAAAQGMGMLGRTRFYDAMFLSAIQDGARQIVNLGAGLDTRAYRFQEKLRGIKTFELDFGPTQEYKKLRVREILGALPSHVVYVPIDFTKEELGKVLRKAGYRPEIKTFYIWEAVTRYLPEEAVSATLRFVAQNSVPGSTIAFDYYTERPSPARNESFKRMGETILLGFPVGRAKEFLSEQGLQMTLHLGPDEMTARYHTRPDGSVWGRANSDPRYCTAVVPRKIR